MSIEFAVGSYGNIARRDLKMSDMCLSEDMFNDSVVYSQQCIEKILKEYIQRNADKINDRESLHSHKLVRLLKVCAINELDSYRYKLSAITDCYFDARYPGPDYTVYDKEEATEFNLTANEIFDIVCYKLDQGSLRKLSLE